MQRNPLIILYHTVLLLYAGIEEISAFVICLSMMVELVIYTLIVIGFSLKNNEAFSIAMIFPFLSAVVLYFEGGSFLAISKFVGEDPFAIFKQTIVPVSIGLAATHSLTIYRTIKEKNANVYRVVKSNIPPRPQCLMKVPSEI